MIGCRTYRGSSQQLGIWQSVLIELLAFLRVALFDFLIWRNIFKHFLQLSTVVMASYIHHGRRIGIFGPSLFIELKPKLEGIVEMFVKVEFGATMLFCLYGCPHGCICIYTLSRAYSNLSFENGSREKQWRRRSTSPKSSSTRSEMSPEVLDFQKSRGREKTLTIRSISWSL